MGLRKTLNILLNRWGYKITKFSQEPDTSRGFTLYTYLTKNGAFDYEKYRRIQTEGNKKRSATFGRERKASTSCPAISQSI